MIVSKYIFCTLFAFSAQVAADDQSIEFTPKQAFVRDANGGCLIGDEKFEVGTRRQMNKAELAAYETKTGYRASDGYAVMMICLYLVDHLKNDHPMPKNRQYVWVAS